MKITNKILSLPPYLSTTWGNVRTIQVKEQLLIVTLSSDEIIEIPNLSKDIIDTIFSMHAESLEKKSIAVIEDMHLKTSPSLSQLLNSEPPGESLFRLGFSSMEGMGSLLQHNPMQMNSPNLPAPILQKISAIAKIVAPEDSVGMPKAEPHCNCIYCQIARALSHDGTHSENLSVDKPNEEEVALEELEFQQWDIAQNGDKLFSVTNRLDTKEKYNVYLGEPIGCTCGRTGCEHIVAVLKS